MSINPETLNMYLGRTGTTKQLLAGAVGVSLKSLTPKRLANLKPRTVEAIAAQLGTDAKTLASPPEQSQSDKDQLARKHAFRRVFLDGTTLQQAAIVAKRYGVSERTILTKAPLFFFLFAEGSLAKRRNEAEAMSAEVDAMVAAFPSHLAAASDVLWKAHELSDAELASVDRHDLTGRTIDWDGVEETDLFGQFVQSFADNLGIEGSEFTGLLTDSPPTLFASELAELAAGDPLALFALEKGFALVTEIPPALLHEDRVAERIQWLRARVTKEWRESFDLFMALTTELSEEIAK